MMDSRSLKKYAAWFMLGILFFAITISLWHFFRSGKVIVTVDNKSYFVTLNAVRGSGHEINKDYAKQSKGGLSANVATGTYIIQVQGPRTALITKTVVVGSRKTVRYNFVTPRLGIIEPVFNDNGQSISADNNHLVYLGRDTNQLSEINTQNITTTPYVQQLFSSIKWAGSNYGIGQDYNGALYEVKNGSANHIKLPSNIKQTGGITYAVSPDKHVYFSSGQSIYSGLVGGSFKEIYKTERSAPVLVASTKNILILSVPTEGDKEFKYYVETIDRSGSLVAKKNIRAFSAKWSPNGQRVILTNLSGSSGVYSPNLKLEQILPSKRIAAAVWTDNKTIAYSSLNTLWSYSLANANALALAQTGGYINELAVDQNNSYIYVVSEYGDQGATITGRYGLLNQPVKEVAKHLDIYLPIYLARCTISFTNFSQPVIIAHPYVDGIGAECIKGAQIKLQSYGLDTTNLPFVVGSTFIQSD